MKQLFIALSALFFLFGSTSCYKDISQLPNRTIEEVAIDTTGLVTEIHIGQQEELKISPKILHSNPAQLTYEWSISDRPSAVGGAKLEVIGKNLDLNYKILKPISNTPYMLRLQITDPSNGDLKYSFKWQVHVHGTFVSGLLIADTKDNGSTSNFTYIKNKHFDGNYTEDKEVIHRNILRDTTLIKGRVSQLLYTVSRPFYVPSHRGYVWAVTTDGDLRRYDMEGFKLEGTLAGNDLILYRPEGMKVDYIFRASDGIYTKTSHGIYHYNPFGMDVERVFTVPIQRLKDISISNDVIAKDPNNGRMNSLIWLDDAKGALRVQTSQTNSEDDKLLESFRPNAQFDPSKLSGYSAKAAEISQNGKDALFLLKTSRGDYGIYTLSLGSVDRNSGNYNQGSAKGRHMIPTSFIPILDKAISYVFNKSDNVLYVATPSEIYSVTFGLIDQADFKSEPIYRAPQGRPIKMVRLFTQGGYAALGNAYGFKKIPLNLNALTIVTEADKKGSVHIIPFGESPEVLDTTKELSYDGFGEVLDVIGIEK